MRRAVCVIAIGLLVTPLGCGANQKPRPPMLTTHAPGPLHEDLVFGDTFETFGRRVGIAVRQGMTK